MSSKFSPLLLIFFFSASNFHVGCGAGEAYGENPLEAKAYLIRYWKEKISGDQRMPLFLLDKASPLTTAQFAGFSKLADQNSTSSQLADFCSKANLLCFPDSSPNLEKHGQNGEDSNAGDKFSGYGNGPVGQVINFRLYGENDFFKEYEEKGATFTGLTNGKSSKRVVEPGKFFREKMLKGGNVMRMPDILDKMPKRSFLPRAIASKFPSSTTKIYELAKIFHAEVNSRMSKMLADSLSECETPPSPGETKRCVSSIEDMIDFSTSLLGRNVLVRAAESTRGSNGDILIGKVNEMNVTKAVSCHQSLFPYLLYYCHSVPQVRVYVADILEPKSRVIINHGVAVCHIDTASWSPGHGAFVSLGSGPGKIEVCHWIFENDMIWAVVD